MYQNLHMVMAMQMFARIAHPADACNASCPEMQDSETGSNNDYEGGELIAVARRVRSHIAMTQIPKAHHAHMSDADSMLNLRPRCVATLVPEAPSDQHEMSPDCFGRALHRIAAGAARLCQSRRASHWPSVQHSTTSALTMAEMKVVPAEEMTSCLMPAHSQLGKRSGQICQTKRILEILAERDFAEDILKQVHR